MGVVGVAVLCVLVSAALSAELRGRYAALLRAFVAALVAALYGAPATQAPARGAPASLTGLHGAPPAADVQRAPSPRRRDTLPPPPPPPPGPVASWSVAHVGAWLACIELAEHAAAFEAASVDGALLLQLTPDELRALGVTSPLHVKKIRLRLLLAGAAAPQVRRVWARGAAPKRGLSLCALLQLALATDASFARGRPTVNTPDFVAARRRPTCRRGRAGRGNHPSTRRAGRSACCCFVARQRRGAQRPRQRCAATAAASHAGRRHAAADDVFWPVAADTSREFAADCRAGGFGRRTHAAQPRRQQPRRQRHAAFNVLARMRARAARPRGLGHCAGVAP